MESHRDPVTAVLLVTALLVLTVIACGESAPPPAPATATATLEPRRPPPRAPTPTLEERRVQTPTEFGNNTRVVDGDIHVWHLPCPPRPPAIFVAPVILTDLHSGSHLYLNKDGSVRTSPEPDYRTDEGRDRFAEVLEDSSLMKLILAPPDCS